MPSQLAVKAFQLRNNIQNVRLRFSRASYQQSNRTIIYQVCLDQPLRNAFCPTRKSQSRRALGTTRLLAQQRANTESQRPAIFEFENSCTAQRFVLPNTKANNILVNFPKSTHEISELSKLSIDQSSPLKVVLHGYLGNRADISKKLSFVALISKTLDWSIQIISANKPSLSETLSAHRKLKLLGPHTPVVVSGQLKSREAAPEDDGPIRRVKHVELELEDVQCLNAFPKGLIGSVHDVFGPEDRHLQLRTDKTLRDALVFRADLANRCRKEMECQDFLEVETPLLFKSTPEGAKEFIVPSRRKGLAYALPQSPQQFKQILMGSGISRYYQIAKCFRDEDLRADRQPEFTQLDLEMSFARGSDIMEVITTLIRRLWKTFLDVELPFLFRTMTYHTAMTSFGSDKPDLRLSIPLYRVEHLLPSDLISKLSDLENPIVEALTLNVSPPEDSDDPSAMSTRRFINSFLDSPPAAPFNTNPHGAPGIFVYDPLAPLRGLSAFGFEAASAVEELLSPGEGTLIILQARPNLPLSGSSTSLGNIRSLLLKVAFKQGLLTPEVPYAPLWVTEFPLFTPTEHNPDEGQSSPTGLSSTHHPFTSPLSPHDVSLLAHSPEKVLADHYDLVINGIELGGGSRRIHNAAFQAYILKQVLKVSDEKLKDFEHLIKVLKAGCPPHAGFALGFDRLVAMIMGKESVRDVIAFPKGSGGEDKCVGSPTSLRQEELERYGLSWRPSET